MAPAFSRDHGEAFHHKIETAEAVRHTDDGDAFEMQEGVVKRKWQGTEADRKEMSQLGRVQELRVSFERILRRTNATGDSNAHCRGTSSLLASWDSHAR